MSTICACLVWLSFHFAALLNNIQRRFDQLAKGSFHVVSKYEK